MKSLILILSIFLSVSCSPTKKMELYEYKKWKERVKSEIELLAPSFSNCSYILENYITALDKIKKPQYLKLLKIIETEFNDENKILQQIIFEIDEGEVINFNLYYLVSNNNHSVVGVYSISPTEDPNFLMKKIDSSQLPKMLASANKINNCESNFSIVIHNTAKEGVNSFPSNFETDVFW